MMNGAATPQCECRAPIGADWLLKCVHTTVVIVCQINNVYRAVSEDVYHHRLQLFDGRFTGT